ncbi:unnamed protein product [Protopolystoma xenopodis]|uniref:Uncharacterized protein n=1 Tax=Protopolystoma xenopodis TaxID=117903 RepID=A0A448XH17_9PLAT|nr:unnamed protein product [Protopolystoma xenopodis]
MRLNYGALLASTLLGMKYPLDLIHYCPDPAYCSIFSITYSKDTAFPDVGFYLLEANKQDFQLLHGKFSQRLNPLCSRLGDSHLDAHSLSPASTFFHFPPTPLSSADRFYLLPGRKYSEAIDLAFAERSDNDLAAIQQVVSKQNIQLYERVTSLRERLR